MLDNREYQVLIAVVPVRVHLFPEVQLPRLLVDHGVVDLGHKHDFGRLAGELLERYFELELGVLVEAVPHKQHPVPDLMGRQVPSRESSCGIMYIPNCDEYSSSSLLARGRLTTRRRGRPP